MKTATHTAGKPLTATLTKPYIYIEGRLGNSDLNMPISIEDAEKLRDVLTNALKKQAKR